MNYITRFALINFKKDGYFILGELPEYIDHINIEDNLTVKIEVRKIGENNPSDYPIIEGRVDEISKVVEKGFGTGKYQLVTTIFLHIDIKTINYLNEVINKLENKKENK